ncbi:hypothetical protein V6N13_011790 [Hibiscus sabdariffa]|uniref:Uncharacterized protein n=1 Tax=Hibiscus sabdariffa TaxID=183260 RepID=A0ABR2SE39_9ROSI
MALSWAILGKQELGISNGCSYRHIPVAATVEAEQYGTMGLRGPSIGTFKTLRWKLMPLTNWEEISKPKFPWIISMLILVILDVSVIPHLGFLNWSKLSGGNGYTFSRYNNVINK